MNKTMMGFVAGLVGAGLLSSCNSGPITSGKDIKVTCTPTSIAVGAKSTCSAELQDNGVKVDPQPAITFTSSDTAKATVSGAEVTGVAAGETTITASDGTTTSRTGVKITVTAATSSLPDCPSTITISGLTYVQNSCKVKVGASVTISASTSHPLSGTGAGKTITSAKSDQTIAFTQAGKFDYLCDAHVNQGMKGSITVE
jgi:plastocyanin